MNQDLHKFNLFKTNSGVFVEPFYTRVNLSTFNINKNYGEKSLVVDAIKEMLLNKAA